MHHHFGISQPNPSLDIVVRPAQRHSGIIFDALTSTSSCPPRSATNCQPRAQAPAFGQHPLQNSLPRHLSFLMDHSRGPPACGRRNMSIYTYVSPPERTYSSQTHCSWPCSPRHSPSPPSDTIPQRTRLLCESSVPRTRHTRLTRPEPTGQHQIQINGFRLATLDWCRPS